MLLVKKKNSGAALITALMITAIVAAISVMMFLRQEISIRATTLIDNYDKAYFYSQGAEYWAKDYLKQDQKKIAAFAIMPTIKFKGAEITATLEDQQNFFNINTLTSPNNRQYFIRLLYTLKPQLTLNQRIAISKNITDWLTTGGNADEIYVRKKPPYLAAHRAMASISELRLVEGITAALYQKLHPYLTALPGNSNTINVNGASATVLTTLGQNISLTQAKNITSCRKAMNYFKTTQDFSNCAARAGVKIDSTNNITVTPGQYYLLTTFVKLGDQQLELLNFLKRDPTKKTVAITHQSQNTN